MNRSEMLALSRSKPVLPYTVDESLTFYCPQENLEAMDHPVLREYHRELTTTYLPTLPSDTRNILLILPCTKTKPYLLSREHLEINAWLRRMGYAPTGPGDAPAGLLRHVPSGYDPDLANNSLLRRGRTVIHRMVISEPMGLVPYEWVFYWRGGLSPASRYDDPGLFEHRGNTAGIWRTDSTGIQLTNGKYRWGPNERQAYADVHARLVEITAATLVRLQPHYHIIFAYVSAKMTHRSFLTSRAEKAAVGLPVARSGSRGRVDLAGVNDRHPGLVRVTPTAAEFEEVKQNLARRLGLSPAAANAHFATGGGKATPLVLPETLAVLERHLDQVAL